MSCAMCHGKCIVNGGAISVLSIRKHIYIYNSLCTTFYMYKMSCVLFGLEFKIRKHRHCIYDFCLKRKINLKRWSDALSIAIYFDYCVNAINTQIMSECIWSTLHLKWWSRMQQGVIYIVLYIHNLNWRLISDEIDWKHNSYCWPKLLRVSADFRHALDNPMESFHRCRTAQFIHTI